MQIILAGKGALAKEIEKLAQKRGVQLTVFNEDTGQLPTDYGDAVAIHVGSGRQLAELVHYCKEYNIPLINGSSLPTAMLEMFASSIVAVNAPNFSISMIRFMSSFPQLAKELLNETDLSVIESHQSGKLGVSATAKHIADELGFCDTRIQSVRDANLQLAFGVPRRHLQGHAYHDFIFSNDGIEIRVSVKVNGRKVYAEGALLLAKKLADYPHILPKGVHQLTNVYHRLVA